jgi:polyisoprenoid-binding protein YceI
MALDVLEPVVKEQKAPQTFSTWALDGAHSSAAFSVRHMMIANVRGEFREISGTLQLDERNIANTSVNVTIKTASVQTNDPKRDEHLKSADFFDVATHPEITFHSTKWEQRGEDELLVRGDLTINGVAKEVVLKAEGPTEEVKDPWGNSRIGFSAKTKINRKDFGLGWNVALETGGILVGEDVTITLETQFVKQ